MNHRPPQIKRAALRGGGSESSTEPSYHAPTADSTIIAAERFTGRWRAEVVLMGLIAPGPRYRWPLAMRLGMTLADFSFDDTAIIARALAVAHQHGRRIAMLLTRNLLIEFGAWDDNDLRPYAASSVWGPGPLAALFTRSGDLPDEPIAIAAALADLRALPAMPEITTRHHVGSGAA